MSVVILNEDNFEEEVLKSDKPVLVDFFATWCGPCQMMSPILDKMSEEEDVKICKIDTDEEEDLAREYGVMSIPCIVAFKDGKEVNRSIGMTDKNSLLKMLED